MCWWIVCSCPRNTLGTEPTATWHGYLDWALGLAEEVGGRQVYIDVDTEEVLLEIIIYALSNCATYRNDLIRNTEVNFIQS